MHEVKSRDACRVYEDSLSDGSDDGIILSDPAN